MWELLPVGVYVMDEELILLSFPNVEREAEITWLVGVYIDWIWSQYRRRAGKIPVTEMVPHLRELYRKSVMSGLLQDMIPSFQ